MDTAISIPPKHISSRPSTSLFPSSDPLSSRCPKTLLPSRSHLLAHLSRQAPATSVHRGKMPLALADTPEQFPVRSRASDLGYRSYVAGREKKLGRGV